MNIYSLSQIVNLARTHSPIYRKLYSSIDFSSDYEICSLPILTYSKLMEIVHDENPDFVFADANTHGIIFESSASTGKPKVTLYGRDEWDSYIKLLTSYHWKNKLLQENDRLTNLCASAYISFRIVHDVLEQFPGKISEIPLGCDYEYKHIYGVIEKYRSNVLAGINSTFLGLANYLIKNNIVNNRINRILAGGELLFGSQLKMIKKAFPNATMVSFMYGTTETGPFAYSYLNDELDTFTVFNEASIVEVIDEKTNEKIFDYNKIGKCVVTSLVRAAAPAIRVDTGDNVCWVYDEVGKSKKLKLIGRRFPFFHSFNNTSFNETDIFTVISKIAKSVDITHFQVVINDLDIEVALSLLDTNNANEEKISNTIIKSIIDSIPNFKICIDKIKIKIVPFDYFSDATKRKARLILDNRIPKGYN